MAFNYQKALESGATEDQVLEYLNKTRKYDTVGALNAGASKTQVIEYLAKTATTDTNIEPIGGTVDDNPNGAIFKSSLTADRGFVTAGLTEGAKAAGNLIPSAFNMAKGIGTAVLNPLDTARGVGNVIRGGLNKAAEKLTGSRIDPIDDKYAQEGDQAFKDFSGMLKDRYGSLENLQKTATEDPFGFGSDVLGLVTGGATLVGKGGTVANTISKVGQVATNNPVTRVVSKVSGTVSDKTGQASRFVTSQATGLNPETITELIKNPKAFKDISPEIRTETANAVKDALDSRLDELGDLGEGYQVIRETPGYMVVPKGTIEKVLTKYGVKLNDEGKIVTGPESRPLSAGDKAGIEEFIKDYGSQRVLSNNGFLNSREKLSKLSKYDATRTDVSQAIAKELRFAYDDLGKTQIKGLRDLDTEFAPERGLLGQLKKDIFDSKGELKDGAISRIANVTGKGKEKLLARMKQIIPDIEQRVKVIKAVEDIERTQGIKVGTYSRTLTQTGGVLGGVTGNIPAVVAAILSQPEIAVPLLKGLGYTGQKAAPVLKAIKAAASDFNRFRLPTFSK